MNADDTQSIVRTQPLTPADALHIWIDLFLLLCSGHFDGRSAVEIDNAQFLSHALDHYRAIEEGNVDVLV